MTDNGQYAKSKSAPRRYFTSRFSKSNKFAEKIVKIWKGARSDRDLFPLNIKLQ
ncbi:hypothetical protein PROSTU_03282 [Providencia stuartii ATCC 25827]|uniref:Uncharacterized protein n=1 Tax=Providencia stuartii ATCC 25827 TaxID=471874 RepID=A0AA87CUY0_PROST|nr:hypothetical protein PROSTU_03282 [Providencia stuartii ATCC 25827]